MSLSQKAQNLETLAAAKRADRSGARAPKVIVLVGIPGSGKSTFAKHLVEKDWARVSQDDLGDRRACEKLVTECLTQGRNVVVDRCNFDKSQRKHWVDYAKARGSDVGVIVFAVSLEECLGRVRRRTDHPTLSSGGKSDHVVYSMAQSFAFPDRTEGFQFCRVIRNSVDVDRVLGEVLEAKGV